MLAIILFVAPIAQLDRASGYEPEGRVFESLWAHHLSTTYKPSSKTTPAISAALEQHICKLAFANEQKHH